MTTWSDLKPVIAVRGSVVPMVTIGTPRRELAYLNAAARHALGDPRHIRWQTDGQRFAIVRAEFIGDENGGRRYAINRNGHVTCTPLLRLVHTLPVTFKLALDAERLVVVARVEK